MVGYKCGKDKTGPFIPHEYVGLSRRIEISPSDVSSLIDLVISHVNTTYNPTLTRESYHVENLSYLGAQEN